MDSAGDLYPAIGEWQYTWAQLFEHRLLLTWG